MLIIHRLALLFSYQTRANLSPRYQKPAVAVRILQTDKAAAPALVARVGNLHIPRDQSGIKEIDVTDTENKMNSTPALEHGFDLLNEGDAQRADRKSVV